MTRWKRLATATPRPTQRYHRLWLSGNDKTGYSINTPITLTCQPTKACATYCYGLGGRIALDGALRRQVQNYEAFERLAKASEEVVETEARILGEEVLAQQPFLRFFGVGDLQEGSARFIKALAKHVPGLALWVSTRRVDIATGLCNKHVYKSLHVMLSIDETTPSEKLSKMRELVRRGQGQFFLAYVQRRADEVPPEDVSVVFAEHRGAFRAPWTRGEAALKMCPATVAGGADHEGACERCRFCFSLERRQKGVPGDSLIPAATLIKKRRSA